MMGKKHTLSLHRRIGSLSTGQEEYRLYFYRQPCTVSLY